MLTLKKLDIKNIWKSVKKIRQSYIFEHPNEACVINYNNEIMSEFITSLTEELKITTTSIPNENVSYNSLQTAAEIYIYLYHCPPYLPKLLTFIAYILQNGTPKELILAWSSILKITQDTDEKEEKLEILTKILETWHLNVYQKIQKITKGKCFTNATFDICPENIEILHNESQELLS